MKCPKCHFNNPDTQKFCGECATPLKSAEEIPFTKTLITPPPELQNGSTIAGKYKIIEELGRGGMGVVYKAEDTKLKRTVALKFLPPNLADSTEFKERFLIEAQAAAALSHPNICIIHEVGDAEDLPYIAMEYVEGETLRDKIKKKSLKREEVLPIISKLTAGLGEAHRKGIIHRDIKSANIMVTDKGQAKVMDFGLAKLREGSSLTKSQTTLGTVAYMSPEQAQGEEVDKRSDLWSLGVVLYEMLTGELPFKGERDVSVIHSIIHENPKPLRQRKPPVPEELQQVVARALKKNRDARYSTAEDILKDLRKYEEALQAEAAGIFNLRSLVKRLRRPIVAIPTALTVVAIAALAVWFFNHQTEVRWAEQEALPEIERLLAENNVWRDLIPIYHLAEKVEAVIPRNPRLPEIFAKCSLKVDIKTEPPGAQVYMKEYMSPENDWTFLGVTPIEKIRLPIGIFRWKFEKEDYETVLAAASTWNIDISKPDLIIPYDLMRILDKKDNLSPGMVRITGAQTAVGKLDDFFIDAYEITNKQFKEFVSAGGYRNRKFWEERFFWDGKEVTWEEAIKGFVDQTGLPGPSTWQGGDFLEGEGDHPVSGVSWYEAAAYAAFAGKSLPTGYHWGMARGEYTPMVLMPQLGGFALLAPFSNFLGKGVVPVGSLPGLTPYGACDMAGNVREWCSNETAQGRLIRGGAYGDNTYMFDSWSQAPAMDRSSKNGFRCAIYPEPEKIPEPAFQTAMTSGKSRYGGAEEITKQKPVDDSIFQIFKEQFSYDKTDLKARVESRKESPDWVLEKISFDAAYGGERVPGFLFLPKNAAPPYQTIVYWGGEAQVFQRSSQDIENYYETKMFFSFLVKNGRAVFCPVYKGFFERGNDALLAIILMDHSTHQWAEVFIQQVKDLRRSIDYLETRPEIDIQNLAYYGMSLGSTAAPAVLAVEDRFQVSVLLGGGFGFTGRMQRLEVNPIHYVGRVKCPTLMLNGKYDSYFPVETSQKPMYNLLGTPLEHKDWKLYETDHIPPINSTIRETLAWLDKYLGPVNR